MHDRWRRKSQKVKKINVLTDGQRERIKSKKKREKSYLMRKWKKYGVGGPLPKEKWPNNFS